MTFEETVVPAVRGGVLVRCSVRFAAGDTCIVEVKVDGGLEVRGDGPDLFEALAAARRKLEPHGVLLGCNGARRDVYPSAMLRQADMARHAYVLTMPRTASRPETVDIFAAAPESSVLATVGEQREWFDRWMKGRPETAGQHERA
jgi:hypothetical protein